MNVYIYRNSISNGSQGDAGFFSNNLFNSTLRLNTFYNVDNGYRFNKDPGVTYLVRQNTVVSNIVHPNIANYFYWNGSLNAATTIQQDQRLAFTKLDSNYYRSNVSTPFYFFYHDSITGVFHGPYTYTLTNWKSYINAEAVSSNFSTAAKVFQNNPTSSPVVYSFTGFSYKDVYGTTYNNSATIPAWGSLFLIYNGTVTNNPPTANAGIDQTITLPTNTTTLSGSGTDSDGTIAGYQWQKMSGPAGINFTTGNTASISITNLIQGTYVFQLTVTDNLGSTASDQVTITVNPSPNANPVVNAGADQSITLPTDSVTVSGSATDSDGTIISYAWSKVAGPASYSIVTLNSNTTVIRNLVVGTYQFVLTATDNLGATGSDVMTVTVLPNPTPVSSSSIILYNWKFN